MPDFPTGTSRWWVIQHDTNLKSPPDPAVPEWDLMQTRFFRAMAAYAVLALMAAFTLDGKFRLGVWIFLAGLAVKTLIHYKTSDL